MAFDFKKEYKEFYLPKSKPEIVTVPPMKYIAIDGRGNPNDEEGEYKRAVELLYGIAYTIKMSKMGDYRIEGFFDFVVPPLEGFWEMDGLSGFDSSQKDSFTWTSVIRMPDFVSQQDFEWAVEEASKKKGLDFSNVRLIEIDEGDCVQIMHVGPFDDEPTSVALMDEFIADAGYENDFSESRRHHEIYLSDARRTAPEKTKTDHPPSSQKSERIAP